jgi:hypothetical protein
MQLRTLKLYITDIGNQLEFRLVLDGNEMANPGGSVFKRIPT